MVNHELLEFLKDTGKYHVVLPHTVFNICVSIDGTGSREGVLTAEMLYECFSAPCHPTYPTWNSIPVFLSLASPPFIQLIVNPS